MDRLGHSVENLIAIIEDAQQENTLLGSLIRILAKGVPGMQETHCGVLTDPEEIPDFLQENDCDYMVLLKPGVLPVIALDREAIDEMLENQTLAAWITQNWAPDTMAITVP